MRKICINNAFGKLKEDVGGYWGYTNNSYNYTFDTQNRVTTQTYNGTQIDSSKTWQYDADGRPTRSYDESFNRGDREYDAAANPVKLTDFGYTTSAQSEIINKIDGNGQIGRRHQRYTSDGTTWEDRPKTYYITSSVMSSAIISEANETGKKLQTDIIAAGRVIAKQEIEYDENGNFVDQIVEWKNYDAFGLSDLRTNKKGQSTQVTGLDYDPMEMDPAGTELRSRLSTGGGGGNLDPELPMLNPDTGEIGSTSNGDPDYPSGGGSGSLGNWCQIWLSWVPCGSIRWADGSGNGSFAGIERAARGGAPRFVGYSLRFGNGDEVFAGYHLEDVYMKMEGGETIIRNWVIDTSWSMHIFIPRGKDTPLSEDDKGKLKDEFDKRLKKNDGDCKRMLNELIKKFGKKFSNDDNSLEGIEALADLFFNDTDYKLMESDAVSTADYGSRTIRFARGQKLNGMVFNFFHELLHAVKGKTGYSHKKIFETIAQVEGLDIKDYQRDLKKQAKDKKKKGEIKKKSEWKETKYRQLMNNWIGNYCVDEGGNEQWQQFVQENQ